MFDVGSYQNAIDILEENSDSRPRPPSYSRVTQSYSKPMPRSSRSAKFSQQEHDSDWVSVPINGENRHIDAKIHRSRNQDNNWRSVPSSAVNHQHMGYGRRSHGLDYDDNDEDDWVPNGNSSTSLSSRQQTRSNGGTFHEAERVRANRSGGRYNDSYPDQTYRSSSRSVFVDGMERPRQERQVRLQTMGGSSVSPTSGWEENNRKSSARLIFNGAMDASRESRSRGASRRTAPEEKKFLNDVQKELELQRQNWKGEIEKMSGSMFSGTTSSSIATKSSYIDTSGAEPRFKAFVDVSEFPPSSVTVNVDKLSSKIIVEAKQVSGVGTVAKTFTQKVQLPRYADETRLSARMNRDGILKVEVPLLFYFPEEQTEQKAKSFIGEVRTNADGSKTMEILVKPGHDVGIRELRVEINDDGKLVIFAEKTNSAGAPQKLIVKRYTLPESADIQGITSSRTDDGCLTILVPIY